MRKRKNSKNLPVFTTVGSLLFLFFFLPISISAYNNIPIEASDSNNVHLSNKTEIYISEGTIIYNSQLIYSQGEKASVITKTISRKRSKKSAIVFKLAKNNIKKTVSVAKNKNIAVTTECFKSTPAEPMSFFAKNGNSGTLFLPVNKKIYGFESIKQIQVFIHTAFLIENIFTVLSNSSDDVFQQENHTRPPPTA
ncbi:hypothetical protein PGH12_13585 [Chryseobacterium wangxinyae]|uniref:hypothetical protein n=1 Tax=Chryseobacterium sp. CY350 TaxID=2997336 RepID=UPI00226EC6A3|nr:hypothetical protein [Chryseobacterium sp. CY350]MCY0975896.1 hypothetical protein [Chryseobacterium sp. CY350]WBZ94498.1 hypothetical protein PGH12_13585 [Chryseobacterium sp. CY350]